MMHNSNDARKSTSINSADVYLPFDIDCENVDDSLSQHRDISSYISATDLVQLKEEMPKTDIEHYNLDKSKYE